MAAKTWILLILFIIFIFVFASVMLHEKFKNNTINGINKAAGYSLLIFSLLMLLIIILIPCQIKGGDKNDTTT